MHKPKLDTELNPKHLFSSLAILAKMQQVSDSPYEDLYGDSCIQSAEAVYRTFGQSNYQTTNRKINGNDRT